MAAVPEAPALSADDLALVADNSLAEHATPAGDALAALEQANTPLHDEAPAKPVPAKGAAPDQAEGPDGDPDADAEGEDPKATGDAAAVELPKPKAKGGYQKRIDELSKKNGDLTRENAELKARGTPKAEPEAPTPPKELKPDDFDTYEQYLDARAEQRAAKVVEDTLKKADEDRKTRDAKAADAEAETTRTREWQGRVDQARGRYEDFDEVAFRTDLPIPKHVGDVIAEDEQGPHILYHLGSHPEEATRIAGLSPLLAAREIGRLSATLSLPKPRTSTRAPAPVPTVGTKVVNPLTPESATSMSDYRKARTAKRA